MNILISPQAFKGAFLQLN